MCGLEVGDSLRSHGVEPRAHPDGKHFCLFAMQSVLALLPAKTRRLAAEDLARAGRARRLPDPDERLVMRIERIGERALVTEELT